jgi:hypothetical protein
VGSEMCIRDRYMVSVVIAIVTVAPVAAMILIAVPIGNATELLAGIVTVLVAVTYMCRPASPINIP